MVQFRNRVTSPLSRHLDSRRQPADFSHPTNRAFVVLRGLVRQSRSVEASQFYNQQPSADEAGLEAPLTKNVNQQHRALGASGARVRRARAAASASRRGYRHGPGESPALVFRESPPRAPAATAR